ELSGTASSSASRRTASARSSVAVASCSATPATGSRVHRGIAVDPPPTSTPRQKSRPASVSIPIESSLHLSLFIVATVLVAADQGGGAVVASVSANLQVGQAGVRHLPGWV